VKPARLAYLRFLPEGSAAARRYAEREEEEVLREIRALETRLAEIRAEGNAMAKNLWSPEEIKRAKEDAAEVAS
jgi:DNA-binding IclR family transcriptional regulator